MKPVLAVAAVSLILSSAARAADPDLRHPGAASCRRHGLHRVSGPRVAPEPRRRPVASPRIRPARLGNPGTRPVAAPLTPGPIGPRGRTRPRRRRRPAQSRVEATRPGRVRQQGPETGAAMQFSNAGRVRRCASDRLESPRRGRVHPQDGGGHVAGGSCSRQRGEFPSALNSAPVRSSRNGPMRRRRANTSAAVSSASLSSDRTVRAVSCSTPFAARWAAAARREWPDRSRVRTRLWAKR